MKSLLVVAILVLGFATIGMPVLSAFMDKHPEKQERLIRWGIILQKAAGVVVLLLAIIATVLGKL